MLGEVGREKCFEDVLSKNGRGTGPARHEFRFSVFSKSQTCSLHHPRSRRTVATLDVSDSLRAARDGSSRPPQRGYRPAEWIANTSGGVFALRWPFAPHRAPSRALRTPDPKRPWAMLGRYPSAPGSGGGMDGSVGAHEVGGWPKSQTSNYGHLPCTMSGAIDI